MRRYISLRRYIFFWEIYLLLGDISPKRRYCKGMVDGVFEKCSGANSLKLRFFPRILTVLTGQRLQNPFLRFSKKWKQNLVGFYFLQRPNATDFSVRSLSSRKAALILLKCVTNIRNQIQKKSILHLSECFPTDFPVEDRTCR